MTDLPLACYDLRSYFTRSPDLRLCPRCEIPLVRLLLPASVHGQQLAACASMPVIETCLLQCLTCSWWAIRETILDAELNDGCADMLITEVVPLEFSRGDFSKEDTLPIRAILANPFIWQDVRQLTPFEAHFLFG